MALEDNEGSRINIIHTNNTTAKDLYSRENLLDIIDEICTIKEIQEINKDK